jgi:hypothetical protein
MITMIKAKKMRWAENLARIGEKRNACGILVGKSEGNKQIGRPRRRWVSNTKMDLKVLEWGSMASTDLAKDRECSCEHGSESSGSV